MPMKGAIVEKGLHIFNMPEKERCGYYPIPKAVLESKPILKRTI